MAKIAVAPLVGAWIEILQIKIKADATSVAPLVGAWIEIQLSVESGQVSICRSPRGSVD